MYIYSLVVDIDECQLNSTCREGLSCVNTLSSYFCIGISLNDTTLGWVGGELVTLTILLDPNTDFEGFDTAIADTYRLKPPFYGTAPGDREYSAQDVFYNYTKNTGQLLISFTTVPLFMWLEYELVSQYYYQDDSRIFNQTGYILSDPIDYSVYLPTFDSNSFSNDGELSLFGQERVQITLNIPTQYYFNSSDHRVNDAYIIELHDHFGTRAGGIEYIMNNLSQSYSAETSELLIEFVTPPGNL